MNFWWWWPKKWKVKIFSWLELLSLKWPSWAKNQYEKQKSFIWEDLFKFSILNLSNFLIWKIMLHSYIWYGGEKSPSLESKSDSQILDSDFFASICTCLIISNFVKSSFFWPFFQFLGSNSKLKLFFYFKFVIKISIKFRID